MNSRDYWVKRARLREEQSYRAGWQLTADLYGAYETALKEMKRDVSAFYVRYAKKYGLTYEDAAKVLNRREMQEWKKTLDEYLQQIDAVSDPEVKRLLKMQLDALSYNARITRLDALAAQIDQELGRLFDKGVRQCKETFGDAFTEGYYQKQFDIQQRAGFAKEIAAISEKKVESVLSYPWSGATFSARLWQNKQVLSYTLKNTLTQGIIRGKSIAEMTKELSDKTGASFKSAERLIRTETAHIHNEADRSAYMDAEVKEYEYLCGLDERTCAVCGALDGQHFKVSDAEPGINFPTMHPNCRCTTVEYDPEDALDWQNSGEPMPERMTYEQWKERYVVEDEQAYRGIRIESSDPGNVPEPVRNTVNNAVDIVEKDFPEILQSVQNISFGDSGNALGVDLFAVSSDGTIYHAITFNRNAFSDQNGLLEALMLDYQSGNSYNTDRIESLVAHELGHAAHNALALKRIGYTGGKMSPKMCAQYQEQRNQILQEVYIAAFPDKDFSDITYEEIQESVIRELGKMARAPNELIAQSFGNYYYGKDKSRIATAVVQYFRKGLE